MMSFIVVCLFIFSIGSLQPLEVDAATEQKPSIPSSSSPSSKSQTLGNSPSPVESRENDVISTPKPSLPNWKPLTTKAPPRKPTNSLQPTPSSPPIPKKSVPGPQSPEDPTPKPSDPGSTSPGRKPKGPLPPAPPPPPQDPSSIPPTPKLSTPKPAGPKPSLSAENEVGGKRESFWKPWKDLFPSSKPTGPKAPISAENEVGGKNKPFWKPWSKLFTTPKPQCPPLSDENEVEKPNKPPFWDPLTKLFPTRKPKGPLPPTSPPVPQSPALPTPKPPVPSKDPTVQKDADQKPTDHPNDIDQRRDNEYGFGSEERTTKKSYLKKICPCCF